MWRLFETYAEFVVLFSLDEEDLHVDGAAQMEMLIQKLLDKSKGSFLWIHLILQDLQDLWTDE